MSNFSKVGTFMKTFGQEVKTKPSLSTKKINKLRIDLIKEELEELTEAMNNKDLLEVADALTDILLSINLSFAWTIAADLLMIAIDLMIEIFTKILPILKYLLDLCVDAPHNLSLGTLTLPMLSNSFLNFID